MGKRNSGFHRPLAVARASGFAVPGKGFDIAGAKLKFGFHMCRCDYNRGVG